MGRIPALGQQEVPGLRPGPARDRGGDRPRDWRQQGHLQEAHPPQSLLT